jgi:RimJ/RimL family protein N-acetyltransferase
MSQLVATKRMFEEEGVTLRDGTEVMLRLTRPDDVPRLHRHFARLSAESVFMRYLSHAKDLAEAEAQALAEMDLTTGLALAAVVVESGEEEIIAVASYSIIAPGAAEPAIEVEDRFQGHGLGTLLVQRLTAYALAHGIHTFDATVHAYNASILNFIQRSGLPVERHLDTGVYDIRVWLEPESTAG